MGSAHTFTPGFGFDNSYARLPERFYARVAPAKVRSPQLIALNTALAEELRLDAEFLSREAGLQILAGNDVAEGSEPMALAYAGHQFGYFVPQLGDGRAHLLGEVVSRDGKRYDLQLKGSGPTPFSRAGDGRAALGPVLREYLLSEAMAALGVPTTRALAAVLTGEAVYRETVLPGAVLTRVAASHLRVGTFQYFAARGDGDALRLLADYAIERHYPGIVGTDRPYQRFLEGVITRHAQLVAQWMMLGFIHGVMNTDNTSISGETIDYGPCAFMEAYNPETVFSSIDRNGRYAYANQPRAANWNLARLAETLLPLIEAEAGSQEAVIAFANDALAAFEPQFQAARLAGLRRKLGLLSERDEDLALAEDLLELMATSAADFTLTFARLTAAAKSPEADGSLRELFANSAAYEAWMARWRQRSEMESATPEKRRAVMRAANPVYIPRNHLVQAVIDAAISKQDLQPFQDLLAVITHPFEERTELLQYATPAAPEQCVTQTFCGT